MDNNNPLPTIDHGIDIIGDEWDELENEKSEIPEIDKKEKDEDI